MNVDLSLIQNCKTVINIKRKLIIIVKSGLLVLCFLEIFLPLGSANFLYRPLGLVNSLTDLWGQSTFLPTSWVLESVNFSTDLLSRSIF